MILQLDPPIPVDTPHGEGMALLIVDYGMHWNTVWTVALRSTREIKHYESNDVRLSRNFTFGFAG